MGLPRYNRREPLDVQIERQKAKLVAIEERLGRMMSQRALEEERLAELISTKRRLEALDETPDFT